MAKRNAMAKFKIGDAVKVNLPGHAADGMIGEVMEVSTVPWVDFGDDAYFTESVNSHLGWGWDDVPSPKPPCHQCYPINQDSLELVATPVEKETEEAIDEALGLVCVHMRIPVELHEALKAIAKGKGWVLPAVMREALLLYCFETR